MQGWIIVACAIAYLGFLFAVASFGDRMAARGKWVGARPTIYALTLAVFCTSWTFFGSVGLAAREGLDFLTIYIGAALMIGAGIPIMLRVIRLAKTHNITSIADFIASRYGKSPLLGAMVTLIAVIGVVPYMALQLKAIVQSLTTLVEPLSLAGAEVASLPTDVALFVTIALAVFVILFGTRHVDATEHQHGLMLAIAMESVVKLIAFLIVGFYVTYALYDGPFDLLVQAEATGGIVETFTSPLDGGLWLTMILLSFVCALLLPRQFHVAVVENNTEEEYRRAVWLFPAYLVAINLFVVPIAAAGLIAFPDAGADADMFVLMLPLEHDAHFVVAAAFIGGLSAATAMVIVACVALSIMVCNGLVLPLLLRQSAQAAVEPQLGARLLTIRRITIVALLFLAYLYVRLASGNAALASIGLLSFAAIAQLAPCFFAGLIWRRGTALGAIVGMGAGISVWAYTMLVPQLADAGLIGSAILQNGPFGIALLRPEKLFGLTFNPLTHGVLWSLAVNLGLFIFISLLRQPNAIERLQASEFVPPDLTPLPQAIRLSRTRVSVGEVENTLARYIGHERSARHLQRYATERDVTLSRKSEADVQLIRYVERILASAIGAPSSRIALSMLLERRNVGMKTALRLLDDASAALKYNRDLLQTALDHVHQGIGVFDRDLRLICWNRQFRQVLGLPVDYGRVGTTLGEIFREGLGQPEYPFEEDVPDLLSDEWIHSRLRQAVAGDRFQIPNPAMGTVIEIRTNPMPEGGLVLSVSDVTQQVRTADELARANETLERRVSERTEALTRANAALETARRTAEQANVGKTQFLAAASHDILQPLNAARLYASSLTERKLRPEERALATNLDTSLEAVEDILGQILDISRLDAGAMKPDPTLFALSELFGQLDVEFSPWARELGLDLKIVHCSLSVRTDRRLLRRLLQNLISNALKYTESGKVLVGCRRVGAQLRIEVHDTGPGIPEMRRQEIFREFRRLDSAARKARGLGLGLSIVERIAQVLGAPISLRSELGKGSCFSLELPAVIALPHVEQAKPMRMPMRRLAGLHVLCVDNEAPILEGMQALLGGWGCSVKTASSRREAEQMTKPPSVTPDVVIVDYHLDEGDGIDVVKAMRWKLGGDLPAILLTADRTPQVRAAAEAMDILVLYKPVKPAALRATLTRLARLEAAE